MCATCLHPVQHELAVADAAAAAPPRRPRDDGIDAPASLVKQQGKRHIDRRGGNASQAVDRACIARRGGDEYCRFMLRDL